MFEAESNKIRFKSPITITLELKFDNFKGNSCKIAVTEGSWSLEEFQQTLPKNIQTLLFSVVYTFCFNTKIKDKPSKVLPNNLLNRLKWMLSIERSVLVPNASARMHLVHLLCQRADRLGSVTFATIMNPKICFEKWLFKTVNNLYMSPCPEQLSLIFDTDMYLLQLKVVIYPPVRTSTSVLSASFTDCKFYIKHLKWTLKNGQHRLLVERKWFRFKIVAT